MSVQRSAERAALFYEVMENRTGELRPLTDRFALVASPAEEVEELREVDVASAAGDGTLFVHVSSNTSRALSFVMHPEALQPIGRHRVLLGALILIVIIALYGTLFFAMVSSYT